MQMYYKCCLLLVMEVISCCWPLYKSTVNIIKYNQSLSTTIAKLQRTTRLERLRRWRSALGAFAGPGPPWWNWVAGPWTLPILELATTKNQRGAAPRMSGDIQLCQESLRILEFISHLYACG